MCAALNDSLGDRQCSSGNAAAGVSMLFRQWGIHWFRRRPEPRRSQSFGAASVPNNGCPLSSNLDGVSKRLISSFRRFIFFLLSPLWHQLALAAQGCASAPKSANRFGWLARGERPTGLPPWPRRSSNTAPSLCAHRGCDPLLIALSARGSACPGRGVVGCACPRESGIPSIRMRRDAVDVAFDCESN